MMLIKAYKDIPNDETVVIIKIPGGYVPQSHIKASKLLISQEEAFGMLQDTVDLLMVVGGRND